MNDSKKIQYSLPFNDMEFTVYYKEGTAKAIYDDSWDNLKDYSIENNGYNGGKFIYFIGIIVILFVLDICGIKRKYQNK